MATDTIYILCRAIEQQHGAYDVVAWSDDKAAIEADANAREWQDYERERRELEEQRSTTRRLRPDETDFRRYWVEEVPKLG